MRALLIALAFGPLLPGHAASVVELGSNLDRHAPKATTDAFAAAFRRAPSGLIRVTAGTYAIDNHSAPLTVTGFSGQLIFEPGAKLVFTDSRNGGIWFTGGTRARIQGLRIAYATAPTVRNSPQEAIKFDSTVDTVLTDTTVENSPAAGILFYNSIRPKVLNATIRNTMADGLHFANCQDSEAINITTVNTGDDGLAFLNYAAYPDHTGGFAQNIKVLNSKSRGIAVMGQSHVTVSDFFIQNTASSGVLVATDVAYNTRTPSAVRIQNGSIYSAGTVTPAAGNQYGVEYNSQADVTFSDLTIVDSASNGLSGTAPSGSVTVSNVTVRAPRSGVGFLFYRTALAQVSGSTAIVTPSYGFLFYQSTQVLGKNLTAIDTSRTNMLKRAIWFENNQSVLFTDLRVFSAAGAANVVGAYQGSGVTQAGSIRGISAQITGAALSVRNNSSKLLIAP